MRKNKAAEKQEFWENSLKFKIDKGFSEEELLYLVNESEGPLINVTHDIAEMHSYGRCNRERINIPKYFPFPLYGDHGVNYESRIFDFEVQNSARYYLAYNKRREGLIRDHLNKKVIVTSNPYVFYVEKNNIRLHNNASGVLVFYTHSVVGIDVDYNIENYLKELEKISYKCGKLVVCMHMHDINKGYYKPLLEAGIPVITTGYTSSYYFVDRFFDIITRFEYATSNFGGSEIFYTTYIGVKYFIYGEYPKFINQKSSLFNKGDVIFDKDFLEFDKKKKDLFYIDDLEAIDYLDINIAKKNFTTDLLGVEVGISNNKLRLIYFKELAYYFIFVKKFMFRELFHIIYFKVPKTIRNTFLYIYKNSIIKARDSIRYRLKL
jgi:hypothetical protein